MVKSNNHLIPLAVEQGCTGSFRIKECRKLKKRLALVFRGGTLMIGWRLLVKDVHFAHFT